MPRLIFFSVSSFFVLNFLLFYLEGGISRTEGRYEETEIKGIEMQALNDTHKKTIIRKSFKNCKINSYGQ